jgi:hypothetical protein
VPALVTENQSVCGFYKGFFRSLLMHMPFALWNALAGFAEMLPGPTLPRNQVELVQIDTTASESLPGVSHT